MNLPNTIAAAICCIGLTPALLDAQHPHFSAETKQYVIVDTPVLVLRHVRVIDGTGAAPRDDQTIVLSHGLITADRQRGHDAVPAGAQTLDLAGRTVMPGLVMVHEHMFYPTGGVSIYNENGTASRSCTSPAGRRRSARPAAWSRTRISTSRR